MSKYKKCIKEIKEITDKICLNCKNTDVSLSDDYCAGDSCILYDIRGLISEVTND